MALLPDPGLVERVAQGCLILTQKVQCGELFRRDVDGCGPVEVSPLDSDMDLSELIRGNRYRQPAVRALAAGHGNHGRAPAATEGTELASAEIGREDDAESPEADAT